VTARIRVGTRRSPLARAQTDLILAALTQTKPEWRLETVPIETTGDRGAGGSTDFTDMIDRALLDGEIDLAVHSAKDLPAELDQRLALLATPPRADPRDCLVVAASIEPGRLPPGTRVGSSSPRRRAQLLRWRPDLVVVEIRGNVGTRIERVRSGEVDAAILAVAGIERLHRTEEIGRILPTSTFLPAPAQGALAVVGRAGETELAAAIGTIDHPATHASVVAERSVAAALGGNCLIPLGALATVRGRRLALVGEVLSLDGTRRWNGRRNGPMDEAARLGSVLGHELLDQGALTSPPSPA
jgi:hydroxymethylbilane synthase